VNDFNTKNPMDAQFGKVWERSQPVAKYTGPDDAKYEGDYKGLGKTFPHKITGKLDKPGPDFYAAFSRTVNTNGTGILIGGAARPTGSSAVNVGMRHAF